MIFVALDFGLPVQSPLVRLVAASGEKERVHANGKACLAGSRVNIRLLVFAQINYWSRRFGLVAVGLVPELVKYALADSRGQAPRRAKLDDTDKMAFLEGDAHIAGGSRFACHLDIQIQRIA